MAQSNVAFVGDDDLRFIYYAGHQCAECHEELLVTDDIVLLQIVIPQLSQEQQVIYPPFETADGNYAYEPYFLHGMCWDQIEERLGNLLEEENCDTIHDQYSFRVCDSCKSGLRLLEPVAMVSAGELQASKRSPNGERTVCFNRYEPTRFYCLSCIRAVNDEFLEMWESGISYQGECVQCTYQRIWRDGIVCTHDQEDEEDE